MATYTNELVVAEWSNPQLVAERLKLPSEGLTCEVADVTATAGGLSAGMLKLVVKIAASADGSQPAREEKYFIKHTDGNKLAGSKATGLAREAFFYQEIHPIIAAAVLKNSVTGNETDAELAAIKAKALTFVPVMRYAFGDMAAGFKLVVMDDLALPPANGIQCGYFFGPHSPLMQGKGDLAAATAVHFPGVGQREVTMKLFEEAAKLHALFWQDEALLSAEHVSAGWLRSLDWRLGTSKATWESSMGWASSSWTAYKKRLEAGETGYTFDPELFAVFEAAFAQASFENYVKKYSPYLADGKTLNRDVLWTLVHGDFHPGNFMVVRTDGGANTTAALAPSDFAVTLFDWEVVGLGSGPQELAQALISHATPESRRRDEAEGLPLYYATLVEGMKTGPRASVFADAANVPSFERIKLEYAVGGIARWIWLFSICTSLPSVPPHFLTFWHDQMATFARDHNVTAANIEMPRV